MKKESKKYRVRETEISHEVVTTQEISIFRETKKYL